MANVMTRLAIASLLMMAPGCTPTNADDADGQNGFTAGCTVAPACGSCASCAEQCMCATQDQNLCANVCGAGGGPLPCEIDNIVKAKCQTCHGARLIGGAPMSLLTASDFQQDYTVRSTPQLMGQTLKLAQLARIRLNGEMGTLKMPQGNTLTPADHALMNQWLNAGAPPGGPCGAPPPPPPPGYGGSPPGAGHRRR